MLALYFSWRLGVTWMFFIGMYGQAAQHNAQWMVLHAGRIW